MTGFRHDFSSFDAFVPYVIRKVGGVPRSRGIWGSEDLEIRDTRTNRLITAYVRNYPCFGEPAFYPFKHGNDWFAFMSPEYNRAEVISLATGEIVARPSEKANLNWCPVNFYVPAYYQAEERGRLDFRFTATEPASPSLDFLHYFNIGFVCGVFWASDEEWLVYRFDIAEIIRTGVVLTPEPHDPLCFGFLGEPEIRQFLRMEQPRWETGRTYADHDRFSFLRLDFTSDGFRSMPPKDWG